MGKALLEEMVHGELELQPKGLVLQEGPSIRDGGGQGKKEVHQAHIPMKAASLSQIQYKYNSDFHRASNTMTFVSTSQ